MPGKRKKKGGRHVAFEVSQVQHKFEAYTETSEIRVVPEEDLGAIEERLFDHHARIQAFFEQQTEGMLPTDAMWTGYQASTASSQLPAQAQPQPAAQVRPTEMTAPARRPIPAMATTGIQIECGSCRNGIPPGLCFCPRCGGEPTYATEPRQQVLLIESFRDEATRERFMGWVTRGQPNLDKGELFSALQREPAALPIKATVSQAHMTEQWLRDAGVVASVMAPSEAMGPWIREALFHTWSNPAERFILIGVALGVLVLSFLTSAFVLIPGVLAAVVFVLFKVKKMDRRQGIAPDRLMASMGGLDQKTASALRRLLVELRDEELHHCMTICVLEYQAVGTYLHGLAPSMGSLMDESLAMLERLMTQLTAAGLRYLSLENYLAGVERHRLQASIARNESQLSGEPDAAKRERLLKLIAQIRAQLDAIDKIEADRDTLKGQIMHLITTVEAFRARMLAVTVGGEVAPTADGLDAAIRELDQEMEVLEETLTEIKAL